LYGLQLGVPNICPPRSKDDLGAEEDADPPKTNPGTKKKAAAVKSQAKPKPKAKATQAKGKAKAKAKAKNKFKKGGKVVKPKAIAKKAPKQKVVEKPVEQEQGEEESTDDDEELDVQPAIMKRPASRSVVSKAKVVPMPPPEETPRQRKPPISTPSIGGLGGKPERTPERSPAAEVASPAPPTAETMAGDDAKAVEDSNAPLKRQKTEGADTLWPPV
jgi:hypothetical protein